MIKRSAIAAAILSACFVTNAANADGWRDRLGQARRAVTNVVAPDDPALLIDGANVVAENLSGPEASLRQNYLERQRVREAAVQGCLKGAVIGAVVGAFIANNTGDGNIETSEVVLAGVAGCAAGGFAGTARGHYVHAKTQEYANSQTAERELIAALENDLTYFDGLNEIAANLESNEYAKIIQTNADYQSELISAEGYRQRIVGAEGNIRALRESVADANENIELLNIDIATLQRSGRNVTAFQTLLTRFTNQRDELQGTLDSLTSTYAGLPAEVRPNLG